MPVEKQPYTPAEQKLLTILQVKGRMDTGTLIEHRYKNARRPRFAREALNVTLGKLVRKVAENKEPFRIGRTERQGPHAVEYWVEK